jgi:hypothetical protein
MNQYLSIFHWTAYLCIFTGFVNQLYAGFKFAFLVKSGFTRVRKQAEEIPAAL